MSDLDTPVAEIEELLFFDTFSHEVNEDINLDLVQFPKPVYITEVRIIPLGARVQADFPGGVRLGATNPSKFGIEFFVNDLGKPGASTFECLGNLEYNQNNCIHLECQDEKIPTDGLVLRGWYTTITLAVYGTLTKHVAGQIASPQQTPNELAIVSVELAVDQVVLTGDTDVELRGREEITPILLPTEPVPYNIIGYQEPPFDEHCSDSRPPYNDDSFYNQSSSQDGASSRGEHEKRVSRKKSRSSEERTISRNRTYSSSNDRDFSVKKRDWSRSPEYRHSRRIRSERSRKDSESILSDHKRPRTPPTQIDSPHRPQSPDENFNETDEIYRPKTNGKIRERLLSDGMKTISDNADEQIVDVSIQSIDDDAISEQFEPILSDDEILGDDENLGLNEENDLDIEMEEIMIENTPKLFNPYKMPLSVYNVNFKDICAKDIEIFKNLFGKFLVQSRCKNIKEFLNSTIDEKENFVKLCEDLVNQLNHISHFQVKKRNFILGVLFKDQKENLQLATNILKIALDFQCAASQPQPGYKIRHIKVGSRLAELLSYSTDLLHNYFINEKLDLFKSLFDLYLQSHMALSIKLIILRAIYAILDTKFGVEMFLNSKTNGYQQLLIILQSNPLTRAKYALKAIMKKLHLFEALENIQNIVNKCFVKKNLSIDCNDDENINDLKHLETCLNEVIEAISYEAVCFQQPKRFLPVSNKFEIINDASAWQSWSNMLQTYFDEHLLCESILLIVGNQKYITPSLLRISLELLSTMVKSNIGINHFINNSLERVQLLVNCLLGCDNIIEIKKPDEDVLEPKEINLNGHGIEEIQDECIIPNRLSAMQKLGLEIAFKIQTRFHIDTISHNRDNVDILCEHLNALHGQNSNSLSRIFTTEILGLNGNIVPLISLIEKERKIHSKRMLDLPGIKYKSPVLCCSIDLLDCFVRNCSNIEYLVDHGPVLLDLIKNHDIFDSSVSAALQEISIYLKPLEIFQNFEYEDVTGLFEVIKRSLEYITTFPGDLITALRILKYFTIGGNSKNGCTNELKYRYVILKFYAADGIVILLGILEKLNGYFEQPGLHSPILMTSQGTQTCQIILPTLEILKEMLTFVIQCRDTQFKDVTAIEHLMKTYFLMYYFPEKSQAYDESKTIQSVIVQILLAYTQPNEEEEELVHKSLWTQMIREIIKNILNGPSTFIPGLKILTELIPLPLPLSVLRILNDTEKQRLITERKLWSAHLHPESSNLTELIQTVCPTSYPQLLKLLVRVCLQLSDLAPNMTLLVSKTIIDLIIIEYGQNSLVNGIGTAHLARLLKFLSKLTVYASIKISALSIFPGKPSECFNQILINNDKSDVHILCQLNIHKILRNFLDSKISLNNPNCFGNLEFNLACALPCKELIPDLVNSICTNLLNSDIFNTIMDESLTNLIILTDHDITFYYLKQNLLAKTEQFEKWLTSIANINKNDEYVHKLYKKLITFLLALVTINKVPLKSVLPKRTLKMSILELSKLIIWNNKDKDNDNNDSIQNKNNNSHIKNKLIDLSKDFTTNSNELQNLIKELDNSFTKLESLDEIALIEPNLPQAEGIVTQYLSRPIFNVYDKINDDLIESLFETSHWQEINDPDDLTKANDIERISCDLEEIITTCMPNETNLQSDCKRILHLSASPQSGRERTKTAPCYRARRVEVEPQTGRPEKKIFVSPMRGRGFARAPPSRSDLFRSRPPNTSRPPSLHVDDFLALETCGAQPTGPTGYNKLSRDIIGIRGTRGGRSRGSRIANIVGGPYRKSSIFRTNSPSTWNHLDPNVSHPPPPPQHFRTATSEPVVTPHFPSEPHYAQAHFVGGPPIRSRGRGRGRILR